MPTMSIEEAVSQAYARGAIKFDDLRRRDGETPEWQGLKTAEEIIDLLEDQVVETEEEANSSRAARLQLYDAVFEGWTAAARPDDGSSVVESCRRRLRGSGG